MQCQNLLLKSRGIHILHRHKRGREGFSECLHKYLHKLHSIKCLQIGRGDQKIPFFFAQDIHFFTVYAQELSNSHQCAMAKIAAGFPLCMQMNVCPRYTTLYNDAPANSTAKLIGYLQIYMFFSTLGSF